MGVSLKIDSYTVDSLIEDFKTGRVAIPEFQRGYVWKERKAPQLLDSLYRNFPIDSILLWRSPLDVESRPGAPRRNNSESSSWLIDGQQRTRTLEKIVHGDIRVVFHPGDDVFQLESAATKKTPGWYYVSEIFGDSSYRELRARIQIENNSDQIKEKFHRVRNILNYRIPAVRMEGHSFDEAVDAFQRINTMGMRLRKEDIQSAKVAARHNKFISTEVIPYADDLRGRGYGRLSTLQLFMVCAFIAKPDARNQTRLHELESTELRKAWAQTKNATDQVIDILRGELSLLNMDVLWSANLLVPLIAVCHRMDRKTRNVDEMVGWLSLAALRHRYSSASETALEQDLKACREKDPIGSLLANLRQGGKTLEALPSDFSGAMADKNGLLAMFIACKYRDIRDLHDGVRITSAMKLNKHHLLPRAQFMENVRHEADCIANMAFTSEATNKSINMMSPDVYLSKLDSGVIESQCIPVNPDLWRISHAKNFWSHRRKLLADAFNEHVKQRMPRRRLGF